MNTTLIRTLAVSCVSVLLFSGCTKRYMTKIKDLEGQLADAQMEVEDNQTKFEDELAEKESKLEDLKQELEGKIQDLNHEKQNLEAEISRLNDEIESLKRTIDEKTPKDESDQGHTDYNPANDEKYANAMVFLSGDTGGGVGFVVQDAGKHYLYTTADILRSNKGIAATTASGDKLDDFGNLECAAGCPFVRIELNNPGEDLVALPLASTSHKVDGNSRLACMTVTSTGAVSAELTASYGLTADAVQLDQSVLTRDHVGGPIIETATGKVLGIVTRVEQDRTDIWAGSADEENEMFNPTRANRSVSWTPVPIATFLAETKKIADFDRFTRVILAFAAMTPSPDGLGIEGSLGGDATIKSVLEDSKGLQPAREALELHDNLANKRGQRLGEADLKKRINGLFASVASQSKRLAQGFDPAGFSPFQRKAAQQSVAWRKSAEQDLANKMESVAATSFRPEPSPREERGRRGRDD